MSAIEEKIEVWKDIPEYEGMYQASNIGNIRSLDRVIVYTETPLILHSLKSRILKSFNTRGYSSVKLYVGFRKNHTLLIHRLIAKTFIENHHNLSKVNHINGNKKDNRIENLEWCTHSYNVTHAYESGLKNPKNYKGSGNSTSKLIEDEVIKMRVEYSIGGNSYTKLASKYRISPSNVFAIVKRQTWTHV